MTSHQLLERPCLYYIYGVFTEYYCPILISRLVITRSGGVLLAFTEEETRPCNCFSFPSSLLANRILRNWSAIFQHQHTKTLGSWQVVQLMQQEGRHDGT